MNSVLHKTMQSLETALRYNPNSLELMTSLAEVYVRLGRFDKRTMELCEKVLSQHVENAMLQQAHSIGMLIDQAEALEQNQAQGRGLPEAETLETSLTILDEFLAQSEQCIEGWVAWTRLQIMMCQLERAADGIRRLKALGFTELARTFKPSLDLALERKDMEEEDSQRMAGLFQLIDATTSMVERFEALYDQGNTTVGPTLLGFYMKRYTPDRPHEVPESVRNRFFRLMLDHGDHDYTGKWLRKASLLGWQVNEYSSAYARTLLEEGDLDATFAILQRLPLEESVREMLNEVAHGYEEQDQVDQAVAVLRYMNDHTLMDNELVKQREWEMARDAELSMAQLQLKNGRHSEALAKFVNALCLHPEIDFEILEQIDDLLENITLTDVEPLLRLGLYFRQHRDLPKAIGYLHSARQFDRDNGEVVEELESLIREILETNPSLVKLRLDLGRLCLETGRVDQAVAELTEAAKWPRLAVESNRMLAHIYNDQGKPTEALERFRVISVSPEDFDVLYGLHTELLARDHPREALSALDLIARVNPTWHDVSEKMMLLEDQVGKLQPELVADPKMKELIGDLAVGRYQYVDRLGSGGMGVVYKVYDLRARQAVAMKILRDSLSSSSKALDRFFREARIAATLRHKNIINIIDYNISNMSGQSFIVMEYVDGPSLREIIDLKFKDGQGADLPYITEVLYYAIQLCDALEATHTKGIIHRDIKPDNIMINSRGEVKITDFGIVHIEEATFTPSGAMLGTPRYMSPEQVTGGRIDGRSDIYSVGILLYEALVGSPPFITGDISYQQVHKLPTPPRELNPMIPQAASDAIMKCLAKRPEERYVNAYALKSVQAQIFEDLGGCSKWNMANITQAEEEGEAQARAATSAGATNSEQPITGITMSDTDELDATTGVSDAHTALGCDDELDLG